MESLTQAPAAGVAFGFGLAAALLSASGYVLAFARAMNRIYETPEGRPGWKLRPLMALVTVVLIAIAAVVALAVLFSGAAARSMGNVMGAGGGTGAAWDVARWPLVAGLVVLAVALRYWATPNVRLPAFGWMSPGALIALLTAIVASPGFGVPRRALRAEQQGVRLLGGGGRLLAMGVADQCDLAVRCGAVISQDIGDKITKDAAHDARDVRRAQALRGAHSPTPLTPSTRRPEMDHPALARRG